MATLTITVPDAEVPRIRAAFAERARQRRMRANGDPNEPLTPATPEEIRQEIISWVVGEVRAYEQGVAAAAAAAGVTPVPAS